MCPRRRLRLVLGPRRGRSVRLGSSCSTRLRPCFFSRSRAGCVMCRTIRSRLARLLSRACRSIRTRRGCSSRRLVPGSRIGSSRFVGSCRSFGRLRMRHGQRLWVSSVRLGIRGPVRACLRRLLLLELCGRCMPLIHCRALGRRAAVLNAAWPTVIRDPAPIRDRVLPHDVVVDVSVVNDRRVYPRHCGVIREHATLPHAAHVTNAHVAKTIVHPAIEAHRQAPVAGIKGVLAA